MIDILADPVPVTAATLATHVREVIRNQAIRPFFQPIVDLFSGGILGYEILSRGVPPLESPVALFAEAKKASLLWELERACRAAAFRRIGQLGPELQSQRFFLNVSPDIFSDERFFSGFTVDALQEAGIGQQQIVIEVTEETSFDDHSQVEQLARHYVNQGFTIALDDFGAGYSSLATLIALSPHFIKLDRLVTHEIDKHPYKQLLLKAIVSFAHSVEGHVIAEGVETWSELELLMRMGVRYAQGYLFARPAPEPPVLSGELRSRISRQMARYNCPKADLDETIANLIVSPKCVERGTLLCEQADRLFKRDKRLDHIVIVEESRPVGLVTRQHFYLCTGGPFGYTLLQKKPLESIAKSNPLMVGDRVHITLLSKLAMERLPEDLYDPVVVIDTKGDLAGTVTMRQLIIRAGELEVKNAMGANPLTNLPGNRTILKWVEEAVEAPPYTIVYADLDRFKEFNDAYGFLLGDELIRLTASALDDAASACDPEAFVGHVGGDDLVMILRGPVEEEPLSELCRRFDERKLSLFHEEDVRRGWYLASNRRGDCVQVPLPTLSLAVIHSGNVDFTPTPAILSRLAADLKKKVKEINAETGSSGYLVERRMHEDHSGGAERFEAGVQSLHRGE